MLEAGAKWAVEISVRELISTGRRRFDPVESARAGVILSAKSSPDFQHALRGALPRVPWTPAYSADAYSCLVEAVTFADYEARYNGAHLGLKDGQLTDNVFFRASPLRPTGQACRTQRVSATHDAVVLSLPLLELMRPLYRIAIRFVDPYFERLSVPDSDLTHFLSPDSNVVSDLAEKAPANLLRYLSQARDGYLRAHDPIHDTGDHPVFGEQSVQIGVLYLVGLGMGRVLATRTIDLLPSEFAARMLVHHGHWNRRESHLLLLGVELALAAVSFHQATTKSPSEEVESLWQDALRILLPLPVRRVTGYKPGRQGLFAAVLEELTRRS